MFALKMLFAAKSVFIRTLPSDFNRFISPGPVPAAATTDPEKLVDPAVRL